MDIKSVPIDSIKPYKRNAKKHPPEQVEQIANSLKEFGWQQPLVIDKDNIVVIGHGRLLAAKQLGMKEVPVVCADGLTDEQIKALRLADNQLSISPFDYDLLSDELDNIFDIDMSLFGFDKGNWFEDRERNDTSREDGNDEYNEFLDKFEAKKTTDDCYTPDIVYDAIADWVAKEYGLNREDFARPFYPGGDYQKEKYKDGAVVVDNPPFSILSQIIKWYVDNGIRFFLFAPTLTLFNSTSLVCALPCGGKITYENGATVATSFATNLEDHRVRVVPELYKIINAADAENQAQFKKTFPKYKYPDEVLTAAMCRYMCMHDTPLIIEREDSQHYRQLDAQKELDGSTIFGAGYLLSRQAAAQKAEAYQTAQENAAAERAKIEDENAIVWELSEKEREIVESLGNGNI